jgi:hypothetical protein
MLEKCFRFDRTFRFIQSYSATDSKWGLRTCPIRSYCRANRVVARCRCRQKLVVATSTNFVLGEAAWGKKRVIHYIQEHWQIEKESRRWETCPREEKEKDKTCVTFWSLTGGTKHK